LAVRLVEKQDAPNAHFSLNSLRISSSCSSLRFLALLPERFSAIYSLLKPGQLTVTSLGGLAYIHDF
jgi:hypothetical protein